MKALFVSSFSLKMNTSATLQNLIIIEGLRELGYEIDVVTSKLLENHAAYDETLSLENVANYMQLEIPVSLQTFQAKKNQNYFVTFIKKNLRKIYNEFELYDGYRHLLPQVGQLKLKNEYDVIISASDPKSSHLLAQRIISDFSLSSARWIQFWGDPMYLDITRKKKLFESRVKKAELSLLSSADKIVYATPFTLKEQQKLYPSLATKMDYCVQGYWEQYTNSENTDNNDRFLIGYFGNYSEAIRNIDPLCDAINSMDNIELMIAGSGKQINSTENVKGLGFLKHQEIREYEERCNLLICLMNNRGTQIPGKVYYYASFNKPVLIIKDGELANEMEAFLSKYNRFDFCDNNINSIKTKIRELMNQEYSKKVPCELAPVEIAKRILNENVGVTI